MSNGEMYPRSAIKPVQALPLIETGAADAFGFGDVEIALSCASHLGEARHVAAVRNMLKKAGACLDQFECGPQPPSGTAAEHELVSAGEPFQAIHNNCSGKHAGMIASALHKGNANGLHRGHPPRAATGAGGVRIHDGL